MASMSGTSRRPTTPNDPIRVAILFGGRSPEHSISCLSARAVLTALDRDRYEVVAVGITAEGGWVLASDDPGELAPRGRILPRVEGPSDVAASADPTQELLRVAGTVADPRLVAGVDVVFPLLHGAFGEDGTLQGLLEMAGVPYVGSGVFASAAGMDKEFTKTLLIAAGLDVADCVVLRPGEEMTAADRDRLGLPVFVKPARAGSSIGISRVRRWEDLADAVAAARQVDPKVLVEAEMHGREIECGVLAGVGGGPVEASVPAEIRLVGGHDWYDFDAKYLDDACEFDIPPNLDAASIERIRAAACRAFSALDCAGLARVDFFLTDEGRVVVNEVNTMPGFTPISMFPRMWAEAGLDYPSLLGRLIDGALAGVPATL